MHACRLGQIRTRYKKAKTQLPLEVPGAEQGTARVIPEEKTDKGLGRPPKPPSTHTDLTALCSHLSSPGTSSTTPAHPHPALRE